MRAKIGVGFASFIIANVSFIVCHVAAVPVGQFLEDWNFSESGSSQYF
jgi:hypothetical protein